MNKPGSHRGANETKKKNFSRGEIKKVPLSVEDRLRALIDEVYESSRYPCNFRCHDVAKKFNCKVGEVVTTVNQLSFEENSHISGVSKRYLSFSISSKKSDLEYQERINQRNNVISNYETKVCPLCENELKINNGYTWYEASCKYGCFYHYSNIASEEKIKIFKKEFSMPYDSHASIKGQFLKDVQKEIGKMKKNNRYMAEILTR